MKASLILPSEERDPLSPPLDDARATEVPVFLVDLALPALPVVPPLLPVAFFAIALLLVTCLPV
jgi:hypothetical protein